MGYHLCCSRQLGVAALGAESRFAVPVVAGYWVVQLAAATGLVVLVVADSHLAVVGTRLVAVAEILG